MQFKNASCDLIGASVWRVNTLSPNVIAFLFKVIVTKHKYSLILNAPPVAHDREPGVFREWPLTAYERLEVIDDHKSTRSYALTEVFTSVIFTVFPTAVVNCLLLLLLIQAGIVVNREGKQPAVDLCNVHCVHEEGMREIWRHSAKV